MKGQRGFTLIEVLVALLVFGLIATAAAQENLPSISENSEDIEYGSYQWQVTTAVLATEDPSILRVEVTVAQYRGNRPEPAPIHTLSAFIGEN